MSIFKGDKVMRVNGTANGFRVRGICTVVDISRTHIKVRNEQGLISKWFERGDFTMWDYGPLARKEVYLVMYNDEIQRLRVQTRYTRREADILIGELGRQGCQVLTKKKINLAYERAA